MSKNMDYSIYESGKIKSYPQTLTKTEKLNWFKHQFRPHFETMVVSPARDMVEHPNGAMPAFLWITCAIDWLAGFMWGKERKPRGDVKESYVEFIQTYFDSNPTYKIHAEGIYVLRNGLVHNYTIKEKNKKREYVLTRQGIEGKYLGTFKHLDKLASGQILFNLDDFLVDFVAAKNKYFDDIEKLATSFEKFDECYLREGFLKVF